MKRRGKSTIAEPRAVKPSGTRRRLWLMLLICLAASTALSYVVFKYVLVPIPRELVGVWRVTDGSLRAATLEFRSNGTAIAIRNHRGKEETTHSSVRIVGNSILLTDRDDRTGKEETVIQTVVSLQADALVIRDEDGNTYRMKRVND